MRLNWTKEQLYLHISKLLDMMVNVAQEDDVITDDEEAIIEVCRQRLWAEHAEFEKYIDDDTPIDEIRDNISNILQKVLKEATETAKTDGTITSDELKLIDQMAKFIRTNDITKYLQ
ncbi:MAG: hypothetical protein INQ03_21680 [Candidatus Heimdallarchaeota archaeon]|nr:hypothetical protein [Candidatus Heimdallarchaeota archaeon]